MCVCVCARARAHTRMLVVYGTSPKNVKAVSAGGAAAESM